MGTSTSNLEPAASGPSPRTVHALTGLRGYAALWVVLSHVSFTDALHFPLGLRLQWKYALGLIQHEYLSVDLFFMLSGFVLTHVHPELDSGATRGQHGRFLLLRLARVYPLHALGLALTLLAHQFVPEGAINDAANFIFHALLMSSWGFSQGISWNLPAWSLSAEWLLYLAFPLVSMATSALRKPLVQAAAIGGLVAMFFALMFAIPLRLDYFNGPGSAVRVFIGALIGSTLRRLFENPAVRRVPWGALFWLNLLAMAVTMTNLEGYRLPNNIWAYATMVIMLAAAAFGDERSLFPLTARVPRYLGEISYALYILHYPMFRLVRWASLPALERIATSGSVLEVWGAVFGSFAVVVAASALCHHMIEEPFRRWAKRRLSPPLRTATHSETAEVEGSSARAVG